MARFTLIRIDDWCGLYNEDTLVYEGHSIQEGDLMRLCGVDGSVEWSDEHFDNLAPWGGRMPGSLAEWRAASDTTNGEDA